MPQQAQPIRTDTHQQLMARMNPPEEKGMPPWLMGVLFFVAVGVGLGVTLLISAVL